MRIESWSDKLLLIIGAVKCALVAAFFISFGLIEPISANAEDNKACRGINLVEQLKSENPEAYNRILAEAKNELNGDHIFWKVEREGYPSSYLFGTMHMSDPRISNPSDAVKSAIAESDALVIESIDALDPAATQKAVGQLGHLTLLSEGTLRDLVRDDLEDKLADAVSERGLPMMLANRMQPWLIATMVSTPVCEIERKQSGEKILDSALAEFAKEKGKKVLGLETVAEQLGAMASLPQDYHVSALEETLAGGSLALDMIETLKAVYLDGNMGLVFPLMKEVAPKGYSGEGAAKFQEALITKRNVTMAERSLPILTEQKTFIAVGALHLPGETGLVNLLREDGFTVSPVSLN